MSSQLSVVRSASLNGYLELARALEVDAQAMLRRVGLNARLLADPEAPISTHAVSDLLQLSAEFSGTDDFGLQLAARRSFSNLGPISLVLKEEPTAMAALDTLCRYLKLLNASLLTRLETHDGLIRICEDIRAEPGARLDQAMQLAIGVMHRILRELLGPNWRPTRVAFRQKRPRNPQSFESFFGTRVDFAASYNGIVCQAIDLEQTRPGSQPEMAAFARNYLEAAITQGQLNTQATVRQLIMALLPGGRCTAQQVAAQLGVDRRTLHRHLASEGSDFSALLQSVRVEMVKQQVQHSRRPLSEVAALLGFASPSSFAFWFRESFACTAREWRKPSEG